MSSHRIWTIYHKYILSKDFWETRLLLSMQFRNHNQPIHRGIQNRKQHTEQYSNKNASQPINWWMFAIYTQDTGTYIQFDYVPASKWSIWYWCPKIKCQAFHWFRVNFVWISILTTRELKEWNEKNQLKKQKLS